MSRAHRSAASFLCLLSFGKTKESKARPGEGQRRQTNTLASFIEAQANHSLGSSKWQATGSTPKTAPIPQWEPPAPGYNPRHGTFRYRNHRRGRRRDDVRRRGGAIGPARGVARPCPEAGRENPHFRRRALQFHQSARESCQFSLGKPAFLPLGLGALYATGLPGSARPASHQVARET